jgi:hypothetical protein
MMPQAVNSEDEVAAAASAFPGVRARVAHEIREALPATIFFLVGFNFVVLTMNLAVADRAMEVSSFIAATLAALVVGKAVLVANRMPYIRRYDRAPLILPILFKTAFYSIVVFLVRLLERFVHFTLVEHHRPRGFVSNLLTTFSWDRFLALNLWICALFLVFVTATEVARFFTLASIERLFFTSRPSDLRLNRRRRIRELLLLSRLADERPISELRDPKSLAHREMIDCLERLARQ